VAREFRLPDIGEGLTEAEIVRWLVAVGETVAADQPIVEVETDKAVVEIPSPYAGTVLSHGGAEGDVIGVGEVLVVIGDAGEAESAPPEDKVAGEPAPIVGTLGEEAEVLHDQRAPVATGSVAVQALPIVRKLAREHGVDLTMVEATGPGGRITREDVEAAISSTGQEETSGEVDRPRPERGPGAGGDERRPMSRLRRTIAANMSRSWAEVPHVTTFDDVDASRLLEVRAALGERHGVKIPIEALVIKAVLPALDVFPEFNATVDGDDLVLRGARDIGIAVDTRDGLIVAVIRSADQRSVLDLAGEVRRLGEGARERSLAPGELTGQTFTVSNIGAVGGGHGTPIVPPGTTAILSVGMARPKPIVYDGDLAIAPVMPLSLSYDHRVVDGAQGRRFMAMVMENLEEPALFLAS
jgi:pyruvate dehydrogenase E2 component (dihydrolipoamide acetyltransferase)